MSNMIVLQIISAQTTNHKKLQPIFLIIKALFQPMWGQPYEFCFAFRHSSLSWAKSLDSCNPFYLFGCFIWVSLEPIYPSRRLTTGWSGIKLLYCSLFSVLYFFLLCTFLLILMSLLPIKKKKKNWWFWLSNICFLNLTILWKV